MASTSLPERYVCGGSLDLAKNRLATIGLSLAALALLPLVGWLVLRFLAAVRPEAGESFSQVDVLGSIGLLGVAVAISAVVVVVHEAIHGAGFWLVTRHRPTFAFKGVYAYAAARDWYIPRDPYLAIAVSPLALITAAGLLLMAVGPVAAVAPLFFAVVFNAAGAVGDVLAVAWLLTRPRSAVVRDAGDAITLYAPAQ